MPLPRAAGKSPPGCLLRAAGGRAKPGRDPGGGGGWAPPAANNAEAQHRHPTHTVRGTLCRGRLLLSPHFIFGGEGRGSARRAWRGGSLKETPDSAPRPGRSLRKAGTSQAPCLPVPKGQPSRLVSGTARAGGARTGCFPCGHRRRRAAHCFPGLQPPALPSARPLPSPPPGQTLKAPILPAD